MTTQTRTPTPWTELLSQHFNDVTDEYGPHSQAVVSAFAVLNKTEWLQRVGEPVDNSGIALVRTWEEALTIFGEGPLYNANGVLQGPCDRVDPIFPQVPEREAWWQRARTDINPYIVLYGWPDTLPEEHQDLMHENLYEFVSMLLAEIIASPEAECTYFREQLSWFHAGHFPCGWEGDWPNGRMRVF